MLSGSILHQPLKVEQAELGTLMPYSKYAYSSLGGPIQNTIVQSVELQGYRCHTGKSRQNNRGTDIAKFSGAALLKTVQLTDNTGVAPVKGVPPAKLMSPWSGGTGIAKFAGAAPFMTVQLTAN